MANKNMRFRVLEGMHHHDDGKTYRKDDVLEVPYDIRKVFKEKFVLISAEPEASPAPVEKAPPVPPEPPVKKKA